MPKDRFLLGIVLVILLLVVAAFVFALRQPQPAYLAEDTASAAANNYLLALEQSDYARAYSYLSTDLPGYPENVYRFTASFSELPGGQSWKILSAKPLSADGKAMLVTVEITQFTPEDLFFTTTHDTLEMEWVQEADGWKLVGANGMVFGNFSRTAGLKRLDALHRRRIWLPFAESISISFAPSACTA